MGSASRVSSTKFRSQPSLALRWAMYWCFFVAVTSVFGLLSVNAYGEMTVVISVLALAIGILVAAFLLQMDWKVLGQEEPWSLSELIVATLILYVGYRQFAWLLPVMSGAQIGSQPAVATLLLNNYGDMPFHVHLIRYLAEHAHWQGGQVDSPYFSLQALRYPYAVDFFSAIIEKLKNLTGLELRGHLFIFGMLSTFSLLVLIRQWGGIFAVIGLFFGGVIGKDEIGWKPFFTSLWVPQRGFLLALPLGIFILLVFKNWRRAEQLSLSQKISLGFLWGILSWVHVYTFLAVGLFVLLSLFLNTLRFESATQFRRTSLRQQIKDRLIPALSAVLVATPFLWTMLSASSTPSFIRWQSTMWTQTDSKEALSILQYWLQNFSGSFVGVAILLVLYELRFRKTKSTKLGSHEDFWSLIGATAFFHLFLFLIVTPWNWDNIKVLVWFWIFVLGSFHSVLARHRLNLSFHELQIEKVGLILCALVIFLPGITANWITFRSPQKLAVPLWGLDEIYSTQEALLEVPPSTRFASSMIPNHILNWFGFARALGYEGHLWSQGILAGPAKADLEILMRAEAGWEDAARRLKVDAIFWGTTERAIFGDTTKAWMLPESLISSVGGVQIYRVGVRN